VVERPFPVDAPRRRGRPKKVNEIEQSATIGVFSTALSALFIIPSVALGPHWVLSDEEATTLAESLQKALSTLPGNTYVDLKKYLDKFVPWVALAIVAGQIVAPRIEETQRRRTERSAEEFPDGIEIPPIQHADKTVWRGQETNGDGQNAGHPNPFESYPGAD
jgi:hypothetical protein